MDLFVYAKCVQNAENRTHRFHWVCSLSLRAKNRTCFKGPIEVYGCVQMRKSVSLTAQMWCTQKRIGPYEGAVSDFFFFFFSFASR
ncbi:hypothetical protein GDO78_022495 [Eleutherodactylus coqui]|uniref:Uncharacterized protein n=1 Tax=Eleutherodactylus coqui TaxID=57060 RepID=A0A8J6B427_ELECQ|nr:hypothetical protein GDO78_022495 [Eleutherodactylus coqui]